MYFLEAMTTKALSFCEYSALNEGYSLSKKDMGIIGPLENGIIKIQVPSGNHKDYISFDNMGDFIKINFGGKSVSIPEKCSSVSTQPGFDVVTLKTNMNWFNDPVNSEAFEDIMEEYISSRFSKMASSTNPVADDVEMVMDMFGVNANVKAVDEVADDLYECDLDNGMQVEITKDKSKDLFKSLRVYRSQNDIHPGFTLKRDAGGFQCKYRTPHCNHETSHDNLGSLLSDPIDAYLNCVVMGIDTDEKQKDLVDYLLKVLRYHSWESNENVSASVAEKNLREKEEISKVMDILKNSIPESHIEEMYTDARSRFSSK